MELDLYHGTNESQAKMIEKNGYRTPKRYSYPGDLGYGIYQFYKNNEEFMPPYNAAYNYAAKYRKSPTGVLKTKVLFDENKKIDLNLPENIKAIQALQSSKKLQLKYIGKIREYQRNNTDRAVGSRANPDGYFIEGFVKYINPDIIVCDRWEDILDSDLKMSGGQINNSSVAVIRNTSIITDISVIQL